ncbi:MAG: metal ABC transporter ATP-binding protein [Alphaproteobacteria bacterium]|nr:metal ABC transporter ATP-binding protein [Alphaproteobacteria bacterium]
MIQAGVRALRRGAGLLWLARARSQPSTGAGALDACPLAISGLSVSYGEKPAIFSVDVEFPSGSLIAIVGPNGAGKSTLLKAALGIIPKLSGRVEVFGKSIDDARGNVAYVPQRASVDWDFPARVIDVVMMGLYRTMALFALFGSAERQRAMACLERVGMADFADRQIGQLSGGQQQRVFLARALAQDADLYLLDEPLAGVDAATERAIMDVLKGLREEGRTVVCVHHDLATVRDYFDQIVFVNVRKIASGPVEDVFTDENLQKTYGGRLAATHIDKLRVAAE